MVIKEKGTLTQLMPEVSGTSKAGNAYTLREFVIEVNDEGYRNPLHFKALGSAVGELAEAVEGDTVEVSYKPSSREHNGRWYDENRLLHVNVIRQPAVNEQTATDLPDFDDSGLPF